MAKRTDLKKIITDNLPDDIAQTGDKGIKLIDVKNGKATMESFVAQLSLKELEAINSDINAPLSNASLVETGFSGYVLSERTGDSAGGQENCNQKSGSESHHFVLSHKKKLLSNFFALRRFHSSL